MCISTDFLLKVNFFLGGRKYLVCFEDGVCLCGNLSICRQTYKKILPYSRGNYQFWSSLHEFGGWFMGQQGQMAGYRQPIHFVIEVHKGTRGCLNTLSGMLKCFWPCLQLDFSCIHNLFTFPSQTEVIFANKKKKLCCTSHPFQNIFKNSRLLVKFSH